MAKFQSSASPGSYNQLINPTLAFNKSNKLKQEAIDEDNRNKSHRKLLAENNRKRQNSLISAQSIEGQSRTLALADENRRIGVETQFRQNNIIAAQQAADKNAIDKGNREIAAVQELRDLASKVLNTGENVYKGIQLEQQKVARKNAINVSLTTGASTEDLNKANSLTLAVLGEDAARNETWDYLKSKGWTADHLKKWLGSSEAARYAAIANVAGIEVSLLPKKIQEMPEFKEKLDEAATLGGVEGQALWNQWIGEQTAGLVATATNIDPESAHGKQVIVGLQAATAELRSLYSKEANLRAEEEDQNNRAAIFLTTADTLNRDPDALGKYLAEKINNSSNSRGELERTLSTLKQLSLTNGDLVGDTLTAMQEEVNINTGLRFGEGNRFAKDFQSIAELAEEQDKDYLSDKIRNENIKKQSAKDIILGTNKPEEIAAIIKIAEERGWPQIASMGKAKLEKEIPANSAEVPFFDELAVNPNGIGMTIDEINSGPGSHESKKKMRAELRKAQDNDDVRKKELKGYERDLKTRLGHADINSLAHRSLERAHNWLTREWDKKREEVYIKTNGDVGAANSAAINHVEALFKGDKFSGMLAIYDKSKNPHNKGFVQFQGDEPIDESIFHRSYTDIESIFSEEDLNTYEDRDKAFFNKTPLSEKLLPTVDAHEYLSNPSRHPGTNAQIYYLKKATKQEGISNREFAEKLLKSRNVDLPPVYVNGVPEAKFNEAYTSLSRILNTNDIESYSNGTLARRGENTGIIITSARDASGEPGSDIVISNGERGARFNFPYPSRVVRIERNSNWETNLETNPDGPRGPGNFIELEVELPTGISDVRIAHCDKIADVQVGQELPAGSFVCTQGRTGSTLGDGKGSGAHMSLDWYKRGTTTPDWDAAEWFLNNYLRPKQSSTAPPAQQSQPQQPQQPEGTTGAVPLTPIEHETISPHVKVIENTDGSFLIAWGGEQHDASDLRVTEHIREWSRDLWKQIMGIINNNA